MLPNVLTVIRFILTGLFAWFIMQRGLSAKVIAISAFVVASISDYLDGYYARKLNLITSFGKIMDPIADKFLILVAFFIFTRLGLIELWMFIVIAIREALVTVLRLSAMRKKEVLAALTLGKIKTGAQIGTINIMLVFVLLIEIKFAGLENYIWQRSILIMMFIVIGLTLVSGFQNIWNNRKAYFVR